MFQVGIGKRIKKYLFVAFIIGGLSYLAYTAFTLVYPLKFQSIINKYAKEYDLEAAFVCAVIRTESRFVDTAKSNKGASGLMQLSKSTADWGAEEIGIVNYDYSHIFEPEINIRIGCWYLAKLINQYELVDTALAAYNAGSGNVSKWLDDLNYSYNGKELHNIPFGETRRYVKRVNDNYNIYSKMIRIFGGMDETPEK